jgi:hypothetical protein
MLSTVLFRVSLKCQNCSHTYKYEVTSEGKDDTCPECSYEPQKKKIDGFPAIGYNCSSLKMSNNMKDRFREIAKEVPSEARGNITQHI